MADFGADVIRIETSHHLDVARTIGPFVNDIPGNDSGGLLFNMTTGKRSVSLDLRQPLAREVLDDLVRWSDVVIESFSPRGRAALDIEYDRLAALRPGLVMMSSCLFGQSGPLEKYAGFGTMGASLGGFFDLTGWPDRPPCGPFGAYSDYPSPRFALCALLAALDHRRRTGEGQYLDFAQAEACVHFLAPAVLDQSVNGRATTRNGNADIAMVPHGVYRSAGDDAWVAIACRDDADWHALAGLLDRTDLAGADDERAAGARGRARRHRRRPGRAPARRTTRWRRRSPPGVPAHSVQNSGECMADPQLDHLGHWVTTPAPGPRDDHRRGLRAWPCRRRRPTSTACRRSSARTPCRSCSRTSATTTSASASSTAPTPWTSRRSVRHVPILCGRRAPSGDRPLGLAIRAQRKALPSSDRRADRVTCHSGSVPLRA